MRLAALIAFTLLVGCKEKDKPAVPDAPPPAPPPSADARPSMASTAPADAGTPPRPMDAAPETAPPSGKTVGVPACDEYLDKMARCIAKLSPESREPLAAGMEDSRKAWQSTAATAEGRAALVDACKAALDAAKTAATAMGCSW
jgi:hypothetical protein